MQGTNEIRSQFLDYFKKQGHTEVTSSPLVPQNDPTLMFTNAGMVPFKNVFTGVESRDYNRAASSQKCVRAGGKHNDLDNVGYTARHHTFFEMLGNFSFGDYFKEDAIYYAWDLITREYGLPADKLTATVFHDDDEAFDLWRKISGLPEDRIIRIATSDNFWSMGDTGPCGPCSEIFYDHGDHIFGGPPGSPDEDGDRFVEIWNLVFMQYEQQAGGERLSLPKPSIDTGMGLERIAAVLQGTHDNYETDLFKSLIEASAHHSNTDPYGEQNRAHRVISDHLRSSCFLIADGVLPANEGRGYVLRRIMRRAMRYAHMIGCQEPLMHKLVPALVQNMGAHFGELNRAEALITETLLLEETRFKKTLDRGLKLLDEEIVNLPDGGTLDGAIAFKLYDTYGFPLDLTQDALRNKGYQVDEEGFNVSMAQQKAAARAAWKGSGETATDDIWFDVQEAHGATEFIGYASTHAEGKVVEIVKDGEKVGTAKAGDDISILTNQTPFYGESGGQMGDIGTLKGEDGLEITITDTAKKLGNLHVHVGKVVSGEVKNDDIVDMIVDVDYREKLKANHSATHILHATLRNTLGDHVTQKGSMVAADRLRFDISHSKAVSEEELHQVEDEVNRIIRQNTSVTTRLMTPDEAVESGAMALFGEKYGDEVRVVSMGQASDINADFSLELCGGTHVERTGEIGLFKIISEGAVASGVRRLEALTSQAANDYVREQEQILKLATGTLKTAPDKLTDRIAALLDDRKARDKEIQELRKQVAMGGNGGSGGAEAKDINGIKFLGQSLDGIPAKELRGLADDARNKLETGIVAFVAVNDGKVSVLVAITTDLTDRFSAVDLVNAGAAVVGGKGGGKPDMAQAGGPDADKASGVIEAVEKKLSELS